MLHRSKYSSNWNPLRDASTTQHTQTQLCRLNAYLLPAEPPQRRPLLVVFQPLAGLRFCGGVQRDVGVLLELDDGAAVAV